LEQQKIYCYRCEKLTKQERNFLSYLIGKTITLWGLKTKCNFCLENPIKNDSKKELDKGFGRVYKERTIFHDKFPENLIL